MGLLPRRHVNDGQEKKGIMIRQNLLPLSAPSELPNLTTPSTERQLKVTLVTAAALCCCMPLQPQFCTELCLHCNRWELSWKLERSLQGQKVLHDYKEDGNWEKGSSSFKGYWTCEAAQENVLHTAGCTAAGKGLAAAQALVTMKRQLLTFNSSSTETGNYLKSTLLSENAVYTFQCLSSNPQIMIEE